MVNYSDSLEFDKELVNNVIIPSLDRETDYLDLNRIGNNFYNKHKPANNYLKLFNETDKRVTDFLVDNDFVIKSGAQYNRLPKLKALRKAMTIENYYNDQITNANILAEQFQLEDDIKKQNLEYLKSATKNNKWLLKTKWLPHIISILALASSISIPVFLHYSEVSGMRQIQEQIKVQDLKLQETTHELYKHVDSLYQKEHIPNSLKTK